MTNANLKREFSAGGVVYKKPRAPSPELVLWLVCKHSGYHKWVLPKGLIDEGETSEQAALREVEEECGVKAKIIVKIRPVERYVYTLNSEKVFKRVVYFLMEYQSGDIKNHSWEMEEVAWLPFGEVYERLEFPGQKRVLKLAREVVEKKRDGAL